MSATDELRRLLDERGVEYDGSFGVTEFYGEDGSAIVACNSKSKDKDGVLYVHAYLTPEQAVEATLGRGACRFIDEDNYDESDGCDAYSWFRCSACGWTFDECDRWLTTMNYCPNCGRKVVDA